MSEEASNVDLQILIAQYEQCWTDIRDHRNRQWQIPLASGLVDTGILAATITLRNMNSISVQFKLAIWIVFLIMLIVISLVFIIQLHKERFFESIRVTDLLEIQKRLVPLGGIKVLFKTEEILGEERYSKDITSSGLCCIPSNRMCMWIYRRTAFHWLCRGMIIFAILTGIGIFLVHLL